MKEINCKEAWWIKEADGSISICIRDDEDRITKYTNIKPSFIHSNDGVYTEPDTRNLNVDFKGLPDDYFDPIFKIPELGEAKMATKMTFIDKLPEDWKDFIDDKYYKDYLNAEASLEDGLSLENMYKKWIELINNK